MRPTFAALLLLSIAAMTGARAGDDDDTWPDAAKQFQAARAGHPQPGTLLLRAPQGRVAILLAAPCCDHFNPLFDEKGHKICAPSGGFAGRGDGRCPAWVAGALAEAQRKALAAPLPASAASTIKP